MGLRIVIIGGHGAVSMRLSKLLASAGHSVTSIIRNPAQNDDIKEAGATPLVLSLEDAPVSEFAALFGSGIDVVYFSAGAGGTSERVKDVDWDGAVKVFDALQQIESPPRLILVSAMDTRDISKPPPAHYNDEDKATSALLREIMPFYMNCKYQADKNLAARTAFKWFILRPGWLSNAPGTGKAAIGSAHLKDHISRDDVAQALFLLADREDAAGIALDMVGGDVPISEALDAALMKGETDFLG